MPTFSHDAKLEALEGGGFQVGCSCGELDVPVETLMFANNIITRHLLNNNMWPFEGHPFPENNIHQNANWPFNTKEDAAKDKK